MIKVVVEEDLNLSDDESHWKDDPLDVNVKVEVARVDDNVNDEVVDEKLTVNIVDDALEVDVVVTLKVVVIVNVDMEVDVVNVANVYADVAFQNVVDDNVEDDVSNEMDNDVVRDDGNEVDSDGDVDEVADYVVHVVVDPSIRLWMYDVFGMSTWVSCTCGFQSPSLALLYCVLHTCVLQYPSKTCCLKEGVPFIAPFLLWKRGVRITEERGS